MNQVAALTGDTTTAPLVRNRTPTVQAAPSTSPRAAASDVEMILQVARDPSVNVDKVEKLITLHREMVRDEARRAFIRDKIAMRPLLPKVEKRGEIVITDKADRSKVTQSTPFARFEDIHEAAFPVLIAHGFDLDYRTGTRDGRVVVTAVLSHRDGHSEETTLDGPLDTSGSKNNIQGVGSTLSYLKRYTMCALLNIRTADKGEFDDDGAASGKQAGPAFIDDDQVTELRELLASTGANYEAFLQAAKVEHLGEILAANFKGLCDRVRERAAQRAAQKGARS